MSDTPYVEVEQRARYLLVTYHGRFTRQAAEAAVATVGETIWVEGTLWNLLTDFSAADFADEAVFSVMLEAMTANEPFVKRSAIVTAHGAKSFVVEAAMTQSGRERFRLFDHLEDAIAWLTDQTPPED